MHRIALLLLALTLIPHMVMADPLYKWVDEQGNVHYSDKPQPGAKKLKLPPPSTFTAPDPAALPDPGQPDSDHRFQGRDSDDRVGQKKRVIYTQFQIVTPLADSTVWNVTAVTVGVAVQPGLQPGDIVTITLDGKVQEGTATSVTFNDLEKGEHSASANLRAADGTVMVAQPITFFIQRGKKP